MRVVSPEVPYAPVQITVFVKFVKGWFPAGHLNSPQQPQAHPTLVCAGEAAEQPSLELLFTNSALPTCSRPCSLGAPWKILRVPENVLQV